MTALDRLLAECERLDDGHAECPDHWSGCNRARIVAPKLARIVRVLMVALEASRFGDATYDRSSGIVFDHEGNAADALAEAERIAWEP